MKRTKSKPILDWLLEGDVAIQYQVERDLLGKDNRAKQKQIALEGWGKRFLSKRKANGHWGESFYQPKWISTHYTLLDLRNLNIASNNPIIHQSLKQVLNTCRSEDGGIQLGPSTAVQSDVCVNGMFLNYASYFRMSEKQLEPLVDVLLKEIMPDGGFNCRTAASGSTHSSLHSTISVLEGLHEFQKKGYTYRKKEIQNAKTSAEEFILMHRLFLSDRTGQIISQSFLRLSYPCRWKYDILRALDYFQYAGRKWDNRMEDAIQILLKKKNEDGSWSQQAMHPGEVHFQMEKPGSPGRWNTLRALRVFKHFSIEH